VAAPDPSTTLPVLPELLLPELNTNEPLVPAFPALMERTSTMPLLVAVPSPLAMLTAPPVLMVLRPAYICIEPPAPLVPLPTTTVTDPPRPLTATPVPMAMLPVLPELLDPELKYNDPLAPVVPAFKLRIMTTPLVDAVPSPDEMRMVPPVTAVLRPEDTYTSPPTPLVPLPTLTTIAPLRPAVETPEPR